MGKRTRRAERVPRQHGEPEKLAACYRNSLALAAENGCKSIAFPCISTGIYFYPIEDAAKIAVREVKEFLTQRRKDAECAEEGPGRARSPSARGEDGRARSPSAPQDRGAVALRPPEMEVIFCCFSERDAAVYERLLK